jgi:hypothetical protein
MRDRTNSNMRDSTNSNVRDSTNSNMRDSTNSKGQDHKKVSTQEWLRVNKLRCDQFMLSTCTPALINNVHMQSLHNQTTHDGCAEHHAYAQAQHTIANTTALDHATEISLLPHCQYTSPPHSYSSTEVPTQRDTVRLELIQTKHVQHATKLCSSIT